MGKDNRIAPPTSKPLQLKDILTPKGDLIIPNTVEFVRQKMAKAAATDKHKHNLSPAEYEIFQKEVPVPLLAPGKPFPKKGIDVDKFAEQFKRALAQKDTQGPANELNLVELPKLIPPQKHQGKTQGRNK